MLKKPRTVNLNTDYEIGDIPHNFYPRPQLKRDSFLTLNGEWDLYILRGKKELPVGKILVPFPAEAPIQNFSQNIRLDDKLIYKRSFEFKKTNDKVLIHFGAVDCNAEVFINRRLVGSHSGGYLPFSFDITDYISEGENEICVAVTDYTDHDELYGKQKKKRGGMWYTPISGIWQTVWLEEVPERYIERIKITPSLDSVRFEVFGGSTDKRLVFEGNEYTFSGNEFVLKIESPVLWTPETPHLYEFSIISGEDKIESYFALREVTVGEKNGQSYILLNGKPYFFHGLLDQGYFPDGIYTPKSEKAFLDDILRMKELGFNMLRKHIKIEPDVFYYYCDKYGMAVFQDMVNNGNYSFFIDTALPTLNIKKGLGRKRSEKKSRVFIESAKETQDLLYNHPSVVYYTIYNEGWGQPEKRVVDKEYELLKELDPTRIYDTASGWFKGVKSDVQSEHVYFKKVDYKVDKNTPCVLSEFGGYSYKVMDHSFNLDKTFGYKKCADKESFTADLENLYTNEILPMIDKGLCASVLTQVSDVEDETNGLLTYDRRVIKPDASRMQAVSKAIYNRFGQKVK